MNGYIRTKLLGVCLLGFIGLANGDDKTDVPKDLQPFQGQWKVVKAVVNNKVFPVEDLNYRFKFTGSTAEVTTKMGKQPSGEITVNAKTNPGEITLKGDDITKTISLGIYSFGKDGKLTLFFVRNGQRPTDFDTVKHPDAILLVLEKVKE